MTEKRRVKTLQNMGIVALVLISLYFANQLFGNQIRVFKSAVNSILLPFGIALFLSYLLAPLINLLKNRLKIKNMLLNVFIVFLVLILVGGLFLYFIGSTIYVQAVAFFDNDWDSITVWFDTYVSKNTYLQGAVDQISQYITFENASPFIFNIVNIVRGIGSVTVVIVLIPVFLFFLLKEKETIFRGILKIVPDKYDHHAYNLGVRANEVIQKYFNGRFLSMFIMSLLLTIMFWIFGFSFERSIFFGFTLGFLDIIPYIGGFIGMVLPILYSFTVQDTLLMGEWTFAGLIGVNIILQGFQGNLLQPYIMGKEVNLHPLLVLTSFIFFGALFGITGIILAIPITGIIKTSAEYFSEIKNETKNPDDKENKPTSTPKTPKKRVSTKKEVMTKKIKHISTKNV
jgi:putative permease